MKNPVIVLGGTENGLGVIRNLGRKGIEVYAVVDEKDPTIVSKYCKRAFVSPGITFSRSKLKAFLLEFGHQLPCKAVLFPTSDSSVLNTAHLMTELAEYYHAPLCAPSIYETVILKNNFYLSLIREGIPHPTTVFPNRHNLKNIRKKLTFPVIVKPVMSQIFHRQFRKKVLRAESEHELGRHLKTLQKHQIEVIIQEIIPGPTSNNYALDGYLDGRGKLVAFFPRQVLRTWPPVFGNSSVCVSVPLPEVRKMKEHAVKYLDSLGYRGIFNAHFKVDDRDKIAKLIEINARSVGGGGVANTFPSECGINIIFTAYLDALGKEVDVFQSYKTGAQVLNLKNELFWIVSMILQRKFSLRQYLSTLRRKKHWTIWARDDVKPFLSSWVNIVQSIIERSRVRNLREVINSNR